MLNELFAILRKQNMASEFSKRWREMTAWQHKKPAKQPGEDNGIF